MLRRLIGPRAAAPSPRRNARKLLALCETLLTERGEFSGRRLATDALLVYAMLDAESHDWFFDHLVKDFSPSPDAVGRAAEAYGADPTQGNLIRLQNAVEPPRQELFRRLNQGEGGTAVEVIQGLGHPRGIAIQGPEGGVIPSVRKRTRGIELAERHLVPLNVEPEDFGLSCANEPDMKMFGPPPDNHGTGDNPELVAAS